VQRSGPWLAGLWLRGPALAFAVARTELHASASTTQTPHFAATRRDEAYPGGLLCRSACQGWWPLAAPHFAHPIPEKHRRNRVGLDQRFPKEARSFNVSAITRPKRYLLLVQTRDELLDYRQAVEKYRGVRQVVIEGGDHGFRNFSDYVPMILEFAAE